MWKNLDVALFDLVSDDDLWMNGEDHSDVVSCWLVFFRVPLPSGDRDLLHDLSSNNFV